MYRYARKVILIFALGSLTACVPFPTKNIDTPKIEGNIYSGTGGLSGYAIYLAYNVSDACSSNEAIEAVTDFSGNFVFPPTHEWSLVRWAVPLDGIAFFNLCIVSPSGLKKWGYVSHIRTPSWAPDLRLSCNYEALSTNPVEIATEKMYEIEHVCRRVQS